MDALDFVNILMQNKNNMIDTVNAYFNKKYYQDRAERWNSINDRITHVKNEILKKQMQKLKNAFVFCLL